MLLALAATTAGAYAQEGARTITLQQAREMALEHNKEIAKSKLTLEQTRNDAKAYKTNFFPRINVTLADLYSTNKGDFTIAGGHLPIYMMNPATGTYLPNVSMGADGKYILNQYADFPSQKIEMANENIRLTESQVIAQTDEAYMQAIQARQLAEVARSYKQLLDELMKNVESAVKHGLKTRNDLMKVQVKQGEAELSIQRADNAIRLSTMNLCHIMGLPLNTPLQCAVEDDQYSMASLQPSMDNSLSIDARPEVSILQAKTDIAKLQMKLTRSDFLPQLAVFAGSKARYLAAQTEQQDLTEKMQLELAQADNIYSEAQTELNITKRNLEQAEENMRLAQKQYDVGTEPLSQLLEAQTQWQQASASHVKAKCQLQVAYTKLLKAQGKLGE